VARFIAKRGEAFRRAKIAEKNIILSHHQHPTQENLAEFAELCSKSERLNYFNFANDNEDKNVAEMW
jgi:hypothetical protein